MKKDLIVIAIMSITAGVMFYFNPVQESEVIARLKILCENNQELSCHYIQAKCLQPLRLGQPCNPKRYE